MSKLNICDKDENTKSIDLDNIGLPKKVVSEQILNAAPGNSGTIEITESGYYYIEMKGGIGGKSALGQLGGYGEKIGRIELLMPGIYNYIVATNGGNSSNLYSSGSAGSGYKLVGGNGQGSFDITYTYSGAGSMESITRSFPGSGGGWQSNVYGYVGVHNEYTFKSIANKSTPPGLGGAPGFDNKGYGYIGGGGGAYGSNVGNGGSWNSDSSNAYLRIYKLE